MFIIFYKFVPPIISGVLKDIKINVLQSSETIKIISDWKGTKMQNMRCFSIIFGLGITRSSRVLKEHC